MRWSADTGFCTTAAGTQKPRKAYPHLPEQCGDAMQPSVLHMASPVARTTTGRTQHCVVADLRGDDLPCWNTRHSSCFPSSSVRPRLAISSRQSGRLNSMMSRPSDHRPGFQPAPKPTASAIPPLATCPADRIALGVIPPISGHSPALSAKSSLTIGDAPKLAQSAAELKAL